jgi:hypothetical protein
VFVEEVADEFVFFSVVHGLVHCACILNAILVNVNLCFNIFQPCVGFAASFLIMEGPIVLTPVTPSMGPTGLVPCGCSSILLAMLLTELNVFAEGHSVFW